MIPLINGVRHSWGSVRITMLGRTVTGVSSIDYSDKQGKKNQYGAGTYPVARGRGGKYEAKAKIKLHLYEIREILKALGKGKRLQDVEMFDIIITFMPEGSDELVTDVIRDCEFIDNKLSMSSGDTLLESELELIVSHISWNR